MPRIACIAVNCFSQCSLLLSKIYVEVPRARLTLELAHIKEREGDIKKAADILQELQVRSCCLVYTCAYFTCHPFNRLKHLVRWRRTTKCISYWSR